MKTDHKHSAIAFQSASTKASTAIDQSNEKTLSQRTADDND